MKGGSRQNLLLALMLLFGALSITVPTAAFAQQSSTTHYVYDDNGRLRAVIAPNGEANVYEYDAAGNITAIRRLTADTLAVLDFSPREGLPGLPVTIIGTGFNAGVSAVAFNGVAARIVSANAPVLVVEVPEGATTGPISVTTPRGTVSTLGPFTIRGVRVSPSTVTVLSGESVQFTAAVAAVSDQSVKWSVSDIEGGNISVGTISATGLYTAPNLAANLPTFTFFVRATSTAMPLVFGEAQVIVRNIEFVRPVLTSAVSVGRGPLPTALGPIAAPVSVRYAIPPGTGPVIGAGVSVGRVPPATTIAPVAGSVSIRYATPSGTGPVLSAGVSATTGPHILAISPNRLSKGATVTITVSGANLSGTTGIRFIDDGGAVDANITASNLTVNAGGISLTAALTVSGSATLGRRLVIVSTSARHSLTTNVGSNIIEIVQ